MGQRNKNKTQLYITLINLTKVRDMLHSTLGLYLLTRFEVTNELEHMNFVVNSSWFNRKFLKSMVST